MQQGLNGRRAMELIEDKKKKLKAKEKLIDELMFSDVDAASIVEQHAKSSTLPHQFIYPIFSLLIIADSVLISHLRHNNDH